MLEDLTSVGGWSDQRTDKSAICVSAQTTHRNEKSEAKHTRGYALYRSSHDSPAHLRTHEVVLWLGRGPIGWTACKNNANNKGGATARLRTKGSLSAEILDEERIGQMILHTPGDWALDLRTVAHHGDQERRVSSIAPEWILVSSRNHVPPKQAGRVANKFLCLFVEVFSATKLRVN